MLSSRKGLWIPGGRSAANIISGLVLFALGFIPLLNSWGALPFGLPAALTSFLAKIAIYLIAIGGFYLLIDGFLEWGNPFAWVTFVAALVMIGLGLIPILYNFGMIGFTLPFLSETLYWIVFTIEGLFLFLGAFLME